MATVRVDDQTLSALTDYALHLGVALGRRVSLNEALKVLLPPAAEFAADDPNEET